MSEFPAPLEVERLSISIGNRLLFSDLQLTIGRGESVALLGPSGSGKTTLLRCVLGMVRPSLGTILVGGESVTVARDDQLARLRSEKIGMVFQHGELLGELTPVENVALPALIAGAGREAAELRARELLDAFRVPTDRDSSEQLSGGERQRVALARALVNRPQLLLADEPTGSLDPGTRDHVARTLFDTPRREGCGLLVVTHDDAIAERADRTISLASVGSEQAR